LKFKSYYWAIFAALGVVVLFVLILPRVFSGSGNSNVSPHTPEELAAMQQQTLDYTPVIEAYEDLIRANPSDGVALAGLGDVYMSMGRYADAKDQFERATAVNPNDPLYHGRLGEAYYGLGMLDIALRELNAGLSIDPNNQAILLDIGNIYAETGKKDEARKYWQRAQDINPGNQFGHMAQQLIAQLDNPQSSNSAPPLP